MRVGLPEALDMFRKWQSEQSLLRCDFDFRRFTACFRGRVASLSDDRLVISSPDATSELVLCLSAALLFDYADPRGAAEDAGFVCGLFICVGVGPDNEPDIVSLLELDGESMG